jgi:hypothetical protein
MSAVLKSITASSGSFVVDNFIGLLVSRLKVEGYQGLSAGKVESETAV